jgi:hypothetical protein
VHVLVKMSGRVARKSINAFFLFGFRVSNFNSGQSNMLIISFFIGHLSAGKSFTKQDEISLFIPLNTRQRSAGCSTPHCAAFCLFGMILFSENRSMYFLMASICNKLSSHYVTAVNSSGILSPSLMSKLQYFLRCWLIPGMRICS